MPARTVHSSTCAAPEGAGRVLRTGDTVKQCGCVHAGVLGGWVRDRGSHELMLMSTAHLLAPRRSVYAQVAGGPTLPSVLAEPGPWLCRPGDHAPVARVVRAGVCDPRRMTASLDVLLAVPVVPVRLEDTVRPPADAVLGQRALVAGIDGMVTAGTIVATAWRSRHYGATGDILIAPDSGMAFSQPGMSGSWVREEASGNVLGMLVGEVTNVGLPGLAGLRLACVHPIGHILAMFDLALA